jgi:PAS domain S-box-containing protein
MQAQEALRRSEARYRGLFEKGLDGVLLLDPQGAFVDANQRALDIFGYAREEFLALQPADLVHPAEAQQVEREFRALAQGAVVTAEHRCRRKDGEEIVAVVRGRLVDDTLVQGVVHDVTSVRRQSEQVRLLTHAVEQSAESVMITDALGRIQYVNPAFTAVTGYAPEEVLGRNPRLLQSGRHDPAFYRAMWDTLRQGRAWKGRLRNRRKSGEAYWEETTISPVRDHEGRTTHYIAVKEDVTRELEVERFKQDVERLLRHDLKSPLHGIIGLPQVLLEQPDLPDELKECLTMILDAGRRMLDMINLSLALQRVEHGMPDLEREEFDLLEVLRRTLAEQTPLARGKGLQLELELHGFDTSRPREVPVRGTRLLAYSVVSNLLQNALEASPPHEAVRLLLRREDRSTVLEVRNRGAVPTALRDRFFEKFATAGKRHGTGLGTYSARLFCRAQGWDIAMRTDEHEGTALTVRIPSVN